MLGLALIWNTMIKSTLHEHLHKEKEEEKRELFIPFVWSRQWEGMDQLHKVRKDSSRAAARGVGGCPLPSKATETLGKQLRL